MGFANLNRTYNKRSKRKVAIIRTLVILGILLVMSVIPSIFIYTNLKGVSAHGKSLIASYKDQNFNVLKNETAATKKSLEGVNLSLNFLFWLKIIPFVGGYYSDAKGFVSAGVQEFTSLEIVLLNLSSFQSELGFDGHSKSGPDRVTQAVKVLDKSIPLLDKVESNLVKAA